MIERAQFYGWMVDQQRILRSYKEDSAAFLIQPGPGSHVSDAQRELQRYLHSKFPAAGFKCQPGADDADPEAARPLLGGSEGR